MRQMSYSLCRFWAYDESKKLIGAGPGAPAWKLSLAGSMGKSPSELTIRRIGAEHRLAGGLAGLVGNPGGKVLSKAHIPSLQC